MQEIGRIREARYGEAISVAADLFLEMGIENVRMADIAERSNVSVASLYRVFETKTAIVIRAGCLIWNRINEEFSLYLDGDNSNTGLEQIVYCLGFFKRIFEHHQSFLKFIDDFDKLVLSEHLPPESLLNYENSIINLNEPLTEAYERGVKDGTIRSDFNFMLFYAAMTHALIALCQKFIRGKILPHDNLDVAGYEVELLLDMAVKYIAA